MTTTRVAEFKIANEFADRRQKLIEKVSPNSIIILSSAPVANRNADMNYVYRQDSNFYYLTGFEESDAVAILIPEKNSYKFILFNLPNDPEQEVITGKRTGQKGACEIYGAAESFPIQELSSRLPTLIEDKTKIYYPMGTNKLIDDLVEKSMVQRRRTYRMGKPRLSLEDIAYEIYEMRQIKSPSEIALMRKAVEISEGAHLRAMKACQPEEFEYVLEAEIMHEFLRHGARAPAYPSIVGSGENCCTLHYETNTRIMHEGELVLVDVGAEYKNYAADITRTFPVSGKFSPEQRAIYDLVLHAQEAGIKAVRPGSSWKEVTKVVEYIITEGLIKLEILQGDISELLEKKAFLPFYMHGPGHWLGLDVHDSGRYKEGEEYRIFKAGMLLTVEPGIYLSDRIPGLKACWYNIGIRIEDDVLVTEDGCEVLSSHLPRTADEVEAVLATRSLSSTAKSYAALNAVPCVARDKNNKVEEKKSESKKVEVSVVNVSNNWDDYLRPGGRWFC